MLLLHQPLKLCYPTSIASQPPAKTDSLADNFGEELPRETDDNLSNAASQLPTQITEVIPASKAIDTQENNRAVTETAAEFETEQFPTTTAEIIATETEKVADLIEYDTAFPEITSEFETEQLVTKTESIVATPEADDTVERDIPVAEITAEFESKQLPPKTDALALAEFTADTIDTDIAVTFTAAELETENPPEIVVNSLAPDPLISHSNSSVQTDSPIPALFSTPSETAAGTAQIASVETSVSPSTLKSPPSPTSNNYNSNSTPTETAGSQPGYSDTEIAPKPADISSGLLSLEAEKSAQFYDGIADSQPYLTERADNFQSNTNPQANLSIAAAANSPSPGTFLVENANGQVKFDYQFDGGYFEGELGIFSLSGMEAFTPGTPEFIAEASRRVLSNSTDGHIVISDSKEGAKFTGAMPFDGDWGSGEYQGIKTFSMLPGDTFAVMLVPNATIQSSFQSSYSGNLFPENRPLFSIATANPNDTAHLLQIADITGTGNTFALEDMSAANSDRDYNDLIFKISGAIGNAPLLDTVINPDREWRNTPLGQQLLAEANPPNSDNNPPVVSPTSARTYTELETTISLDNQATDAEGDPLTISVLNPVNGTVIFNPLTNKASFKPAIGFSGIASFDFLASDAFGSSTPARVTVNVSDVPLLNLDFVKRNPILNAGENTELVVLGDFADQKGVVLPDSYLTYTSINPEVAPIDAAGKVTGLTNGTSILSASRNNLQAVTPIRIGAMPQPTTDAQLHQILAEMYGLDPYPDAVSLTPGATRKLSLGLNPGLSEVNLTAASTGTRYFSNNSNILRVSPDGTITAVGVGDAAVTAIYGAAEATIPVRVEAPRSGPATVGAAGGVVLSSDGELMVMMPPGALNSDTNVSIASLNRSELSLPVPTGFEFAGAFNLNFGDSSLEQPVQLAVPAPEGLPAGTEVYFMRKGALPDETGVWKPIWLQEESGVVGDDGTIRTSSPPYPGVVRPGEYIIVYSSPTGDATLVKGQLTLNYDFPLAFFGIIDPLGGIGQLIDPSNFVTNFGFTVSYDISSVKVIAIPKVGLPIVTELGVQRNSNGVATLEANLNIPTPAASNSAAAPKLQAASLKFKDENNQPFEGNEPILFLKASNVLASNLGDPKGSRLEDLVVKFYVGDRVYEQAILPNLSATLGDNQFEVAVKVPNTVVLGESYISLSRRQNQLVDQNLTEPVYEEIEYNSNPIWLDAGAEYVFAALKGADAVAVLDGTDPESVVAASSSSNLLLSTIPVGDGAIDRPRDLAVTSDGTRVYVALEQSGRVALVDPMVLQQVDTKPDTPGINPIDLPIGATPRSIAIDPRNQYAYISDGKRGNIYVLDIDPFSEEYHQVIQTISLSSVTGGLNEIAISSDGRKLFATAPGFPTSQIIAVNIDPEDQPLDPSQNPRKWHQEIGVVNTFAGVQGMAATAEPNRMTFTNTSNDSKGFGVLTITNDDPTSFAATANDYAALSLGDPLMGGSLDYFDVNRAVAVTVMRDGSYAFVAAKNDSPQTGVESIDGVRAGSNIGIIKDPFGPTPKLVAATRPIPQGATTDLVLSNDNKYLYASYPTLSGDGGVYVFDVEEIIRTLENPGDFKIDNLDRGVKSPYFNPATSRPVSSSKFQSVPIDDINPAISIAADYGIVTGDWPRNQFTYGVFDSKHSPIATAGSPWGMAASLSIQEDEKERLQELSQRIAELVEMRDTADNPNDVDKLLERPIRQRDGLLRKISVEVQRDKYGDEVNVSPVELEGGRLIFEINYENLFQTFYGSSSVAWNIAPLEKRAVFDIGRELASQRVNLPAGTKLKTMLGFGGTTAQGLVQPYPGDIDYVETFDVSAPNAQNAATAIVDTLIDFVRRNQTNPRVEFEKIMIRSSKGERLVYKSLSELENNRSTISEALQGLNGTDRDFINTFWRAKVDGNRFIGITKVLGISAKQATTGEILFSTQPFSEDAEFYLIEEDTSTTNLPLETRPGGAEFQTAFILKQPETFPKEKLGWYASTMRKEVFELVFNNKKDPESGYNPDGKYLKAAKRAFNYFMALGNIEAMEAITPVFSTLQAQVNQQVTVMEAIRAALNPEEVSTRILKTYDAEAMLNNVANIIDGLLPGVGGEVNKTPAQIAAELREFAAQLEETSDGFLKQNKDQGNSLAILLNSAKSTINRGVREMVQPILDTYLINYHQNLP
ncbi:DUF4114 domain-containing protein [Microcoleus sp. T2B6]|uniref:DUF4114 domain-containing protein n=1 Tax=Microcoleus sp. T2B6 TaxID=3055424 RepID=UPI002FD3F254